MTIQNIYNNLPSITSVGAFFGFNQLESVEVFNAFSFVTFAQGIKNGLIQSLFAQILTQPWSIQTNLVRNCVDSVAAVFIKKITIIKTRHSVVHPRPMLSSCVSIVLVAAWRFATDPTYTFLDATIMGITILSDIFLPEIPDLPDLKKYLTQLRAICSGFTSANKQLLQACKKGNISQAREALKKGANSNLYLKEAFESGHAELILFLLDKTNNHQKLWSFILKKIAFTQRSSPKNEESDMFDRNQTLNIAATIVDNMPLFINGVLFDPYPAISAIFDKDNIKLFEGLWNSSEEIHKYGKAILKFALNRGAGKICSFLLEQGIQVSELEQIKKTYKLNLQQFLPILILSINGLEGIKQFAKSKYNIIDFKKYLNLSEIDSEESLHTCTGIYYKKLLNDLFINKCTIWEMAIYLGLKCEKEIFREEDQFGLRPLDYAILFYHGLGNGLFNYLIRRDKSLITLGNHHTCLHIAALVYNKVLSADFLNYDENPLKILLDLVGEVFPKPNQKHPLFIQELWKDQPNRQPYWKKIDLINRQDVYGLTSLHYVVGSGPIIVMDQHLNRMCKSIFLRLIHLLLKSGAKEDIQGPLIKNKDEKRCSTYLPMFFLEKSNGQISTEEEQIEDKESQLFRLSALELAKANKSMEYGLSEHIKWQRDIFEICAQLLEGRKTLVELEKSKTIIS